NDKDVSLRKWAILSLGKLKAEDALAALASLVTSVERELRAAIAQTLGNFSEKATQAPLLQLLRDSDETVRIEAAETLKKQGNRQAVPALVEMLQKQPAIRGLVIDILGNLGDPQATPALIPILQQGEPALKAEAAWALGRLGSTQAVGPLTHALADPNAEV